MHTFKRQFHTTDDDFIILRFKRDIFTWHNVLNRISTTLIYRNLTESRIVVDFGINAKLNYATTWLGFNVLDREGSLTWASVSASPDLCSTMLDRVREPLILF